MVINTPAFVILPGSGTVTPPRILVLFLIDFSETIHISVSNKLGNVPADGALVTDIGVNFTIVQMYFKP